MNLTESMSMDEIMCASCLKDIYMAIVCHFFLDLCWMFSKCTKQIETIY